jgi:hypothetical protein
MTIVNPDLDPGARQRSNKKSKLYFFLNFQPENCNANVHTKIVLTTDKKKFTKIAFNF